MPGYLVTWAVDVEAASPDDAAKKVASVYFQDRIARGLPFTACTFTVREHKTAETNVVDLALLALRSRIQGDTGHE